MYNGNDHGGETKAPSTQNPEVKPDAKPATAPKPKQDQAKTPSKK